VGYDGAVSRVRVLTGDRTLAAAAIEAVRQWRYEPSAPHLERETNITISIYLERSRRRQLSQLRAALSLTQLSG
jgi:outer membrane biosynthesis protein TonB